MKWVINTGRDLPGIMEAIGRSRLTVHPDYLALVEREIYVREHHSYVPLTEWNQRCAEDHEVLFSRLSRELGEMRDWIEQRFQADLYADTFSPLCVIASSLAEMDVIHDFLDAFAAKTAALSVVRNDVYLRLSHRDYHKGSVLQRIAEREGVSGENILAAGDHHNDLPMLRREVAHMLVAPANAIEAVKGAVRTQGGFIAQQRCGAGVLEGLRHFGARF
jgi:hydroxymethylpyrimidine pyrophosphatase-like HAD family hydrolase